jgi:hypothetical protein
MLQDTVSVLNSYEINQCWYYAFNKAHQFWLTGHFSFVEKYHNHVTLIHWVWCMIKLAAGIVGVKNDFWANFFWPKFFFKKNLQNICQIWLPRIFVNITLSKKCFRLRSHLIWLQEFYVSYRFQCSKKLRIKNITFFIKPASFSYFPTYINPNTVFQFAIK